MPFYSIQQGTKEMGLFSASSPAEALRDFEIEHGIDSTYRLCVSLVENPCEQVEYDEDLGTINYLNGPMTDWYGLLDSEPGLKPERITDLKGWNIYNALYRLALEDGRVEWWAVRESEVTG